MINNKEWSFNCLSINELSDEKLIILLSKLDKKEKYKSCLNFNKSSKYIAKNKNKNKNK